MGNCYVVVGDFGPGELLEEFGEGERLGSGSEAGEVGNEAEELLGRIALAEVPHIKRGVALGETLTGNIEEEGDVAEHGRLLAEKAEEVYLLGGREEEVAATDYLGDTRQSIVNDHGELVGPGSVTTAEDEVAAMLGEIDALGTVVGVGEENIGVGDADAQGAGSVVGLAARAGIDHAAVGLVGCLGGENIGAGALAVVSVGAQDGKRLLVEVGALALTAETVPFKAEPVEVVGYLVGIFAAGALGVDVLNAEEPLPSPAAG